MILREICMEKNLTSIEKFLNATQHTNVILIDVPLRCDLGKRPHINEKIINYNRKLHKVTKRFKNVQFFFFFLISLLIGWQLSIWICCKLFFSLLYNCPLLCSWRLALIIVVEVFPWPFFPDIAPSIMFTTNSLCLIIFPIHEWRLLFKKFFKSILSSFSL